jgi:hypothetical protein
MAVREWIAAVGAKTVEATLAALGEAAARQKDVAR